MEPKNIKRMLLSIVILALLAGCSLPNQPVVEPTVDANVVAQTVAAVQTQAVQAALAQLTQTAAAMPTATNTALPTDTAVPTETATMLPTSTLPPIPTATATFILPTATRIPVTLAPTLTFTPSAYQCSVTSLNPPTNATITRGGDFDLKVTLKNVGTTAWIASDVDFAYISGAEFQESVDALDLPEEISTGESVTFIVDMVADTDTGRQTAVWGLKRSGSTFCSFTIAIQVN